MQQLLETILSKLNHQHAMLHALLHAVADLARHQGGLTAEQTAEVLARLKNHAATLEGIAAEPTVEP